jgi:hypothetical protein
MNEYQVKELNKCEDAVMSALFIMSRYANTLRDRAVLQHILEAGNHLTFAVEEIKEAKKIIAGA